MANEEQYAILEQDVHVWNRWREENRDTKIDLSEADLIATDLSGANLIAADLSEADLSGANLDGTDLSGANLKGASFITTHFIRTRLGGANLSEAGMGETVIASSDLSEAIGLADIIHAAPSVIGIDILVKAKGNIPEIFLRGCGLSDWEIEQAKLYNPGLSNDQINSILYKIYDLRATQALQISPLFISYSHGNNNFVDKLERQLNIKGIRYWRDTHDMKAGPIETQIDRGIRQNPTVLLVLSENSLKSDWVEHEVLTARELERELGRDVLCPVALDDSWKTSRWPKRIMEQIMEYNILDFSDWQDDVKFDGMFRKLIDGLELFYKPDKGA